MFCRVHLHQTEEFNITWHVTNFSPIAQSVERAAVNR